MDGEELARRELEFDFVCSVPDSLVCRVCLCTAREPQLTGCHGYNVCKTCLDKWKKSKAEEDKEEGDSTGLVPCPVCGTLSIKTFPNKLSDREIRKQHVYCFNKVKGCQWKGKMSDIKKHNENCLHEEVLCPNNCGMMVQQQYYNLHAKAECPNCKISC